MYCAFPNVFNTMIYLPSPFLGAWMFASSHILTHPCRSSYVLVYPHIFSHISAVHLISLQIFVDPCRSSYLFADLHIYAKIPVSRSSSLCICSHILVYIAYPNRSSYIFVYHRMSSCILAHPRRSSYILAAHANPQLY